MPANVIPSCIWLYRMHHTHQPYKQIWACPLPNGHLLWQPGEGQPQGEGIGQKDKRSKTQDEVIAKTQCSKANSRLKNQLQRFGVLLSNFHQKKCPTPPFHMEKEGGV